jgi:hypothetical protein
MSNVLFKVTGWSLLALAWTWLTLEWLPSYANSAQFKWVAAALGSDEPDMPPQAELHPIVKLAAESPIYTLLAGVLVVMWCYLLVTKIRQRPAETVKETEVNSNIAKA